MTTGMPAERLDDAPIRAILLVLVGHRRAADDEELGAHQPDALGAAARGRFGLLRDVDVRAQRDAHAVERDRLERGELGERRLRRPPPRAARSWYAAISSSVGIDREHAGAAVEHDALAALQLGGRVRRPTTAGSPSDRARIATCDVRVPASVAIAAIASRSSCTVRLGVRSCVTRIAFDAWRQRRPDRDREARAAARARGCARR